MFKKLLLLLCLIATAFFGVWCIKTHSIEIQSQINEDVAVLLRENDAYKDINATIDGRDVTLNGYVSDQNITNAITQSMGALGSIRILNNNIMVKTPKDIAIDTNITLKEAQAQIDPINDIDSNAPTEVVNDNLSQPSNNELQQIQQEKREQEIAQRAQCEDIIRDLLSKSGIQFESAQSTLKSESKALLDTIIEETNKCPSSLITVEGHSDSSGDAYKNLLLSAERANAVTDYLESNGIQMPIKHIGYGIQRPIASNETAEGRAKNRRIMFLLEPLPTVQNDLKSEASDSEVKIEIEPENDYAEPIKSQTQETTMPIPTLEPLPQLDDIQDIDQIINK